MDFKEGDRVEVCQRKGEQFGSWFTAKVSSVDGDFCTVKYELFLTFDGKPVVETVNKEDIRSCVPVALSSCKDRWIARDIVEVFDAFSWRVGKIVKILKGDRVVIKLFGSIQLRQYSVSDLRVPQVWQKNQLNLADTANRKKEVACDYTPFEFHSARKQDFGTNRGIVKQDTSCLRVKHKRVGGNSIRNLKRNLDSCCRFSSADLNRITDKKQKWSRRVLPKEVDGLSFPKDMISGHFRHVFSRGTIARNAMGDRSEDAMNSLSIPLMVSEEEDDECSVASCSSGKEALAHSHQNGHLKGNKFTSRDDAMSSCSLKRMKEFQSEYRDGLAANVHELELHAYRSTVQAFHASGPLSWEQESLLTNLRLSLNISNEEHLLHLRHLLSA
ncbi:uncharacterized protein LOC122021262 [Zingiber officinale]|uniref:ENT domain-containing protein n=1 Tax=Zingiber officinale TaxID=94328 RepID=A0A8J5KIM6_ZINOF|nr:uncharacterized protein LOC122021262 [Zingiber officinale]KAG6478348.1 hypothetical protein ZIOFF_061790 [Zingiber officinale]